MDSFDEPMLRRAAAPAAPKEPLPLEQRIRALLESQRYAVLCTQGDDNAYGSLIAFAVTPDLARMVFTTPTTTRKFKLLNQSGHVALLVDDRSAGHDDLMDIQAVTATGRAARILEPSAFARWSALLLGRHPHFEPFVESPSSALFVVDVVRYFHVTRLREVNEWRPHP